MALNFVNEKNKKVLFPPVLRGFMLLSCSEFRIKLENKNGKRKEKEFGVV